MEHKLAKQDLVSAKAKHYLFKSKLRAYLENSPDVDEKVLADHNLCGVGQWITNIGKIKYGSFSQIEELDIIHQSIHKTAKEIIDLKKQGQQKEAEARMPEINTIGNQIVGKIDELMQELEKE